MNQQSTTIRRRLERKPVEENAIVEKSKVPNPRRIAYVLRIITVMLFLIGAYSY